MQYLEVNFVLSKNNSQNFLISVCNSNAKIIGTHHLSNGTTSISKWEFFAKLEFTSEQDIKEFVHIYDGQFEVSDIVGGNF